MGTRTRTNTALLGSASAGAILSTVATVVQTALILATTSPPTLARLVLPLVCAGTVAVIYGVIFMVVALREPLPDTLDRDRERPVNVRVALFFAATLTIVLVVSAALDTWFGRAGLVAAALVAGFADAHAPAASAASLVAAGKLPVGDAVVPVLGAITTNTLTKMVLAAVGGGAPFARRIIPGLILVAVAAWAGAAVVR
jgi:uncharacterized membrane protein (DUF4010 family)